MSCVSTPHDCDHVVMSDKRFRYEMRRLYVIGMLLGAWFASCICWAVVKG